MTWLESFLAARPALFRVIGRLVRPDEIEDIVQETFAQSYAASCHQHIRNPKAFMLKTARNLALNYINRSDRKLCVSIDDLQELEELKDFNSVEKQIHSEEQFLEFCKATSSLPVICRRVFILKKVYGLSQKEIAEHLNISPSTVEKHVAKGMLLTIEFLQKSDKLAMENVNQVSIHARKRSMDFE